MTHPADATCRQCGFAEQPRAVEQEDGSMSDPTCLRCGLTANEHMPALRMALARAWGLVASLRLAREGANRGDQHRARPSRERA